MDTTHDHETATDHDQETATGHDHEATVVSEEVHDNSWSVNLEKAKYKSSPERAIRDAITAIDHTNAGYHVNLVTHATLGHPEEFLFDALDSYERQEIEWTYVDQCGCGGHVTRVHVHE